MYPESPLGPVPDPFQSVHPPQMPAGYADPDVADFAAESGDMSMPKERNVRLVVMVATLVALVIATGIYYLLLL